MSIVSTSLEKRLMMRPTGVVSKNCMGLRRMLSRRDECNAVEAFIDAKAITQHTLRVATTEDVESINITLYILLWVNY